MWFGWQHGGPLGCGGGILIWLLILLAFFGFMALLVGGIVWATRSAGRRPSEPQAGDALDVARRRLAAGEISIEEFEEIRQRLGR